MSNEKKKPPMETLTHAVGPQTNGLTEQAQGAAASEPEQSVDATAAPDPAGMERRRSARKTRGES